MNFVPTGESTKQGTPNVLSFDFSFIGKAGERSIGIYIFPKLRERSHSVGGIVKVLSSKNTNCNTFEIGRKTQ